MLVLCLKEEGILLSLALQAQSECNDEGINRQKYNYMKGQLNIVPKEDVEQLVSARLHHLETMEGQKSFCEKSFSVYLKFRQKRAEFLR